MTDTEKLLDLDVPALPDTYWHKLALARGDLLEEIAKIEPNPSEAQKKSGNYRKAHVTWKGLGLTFETGAGQTRSGVSADGKAWSTKMRDHYGYIKRTMSEADRDHLDIFLVGDSGGSLDSELVFIVNQCDPATGKFDEHKIMLGFYDAASAEAAYLRNYETGWKGLDSIVPITLTDFKDWIFEGDTSKPFVAASSRRRSKDACASLDLLALDRFLPTA